MSRPTITLRSIKIHHELCQETDCFSANIYLGTRRIGEVSNDGKGGPDFFEFKTVKDRNIFHKKVKEKYPDTHPETAAELFIQDLIHQWELQKFFKRTWKQGLLAFRLKSDKPGVWRTAPYHEKSQQYIRNRFGDDVEDIQVPPNKEPSKGPLAPPLFQR